MRNPVSTQVIRQSLMAALVFLLSGIAASSEIRFIGTVAVSGKAVDNSKASGAFTDGTPRNRLGGFSAIDYDARRDIFYVLPDRGPADGAFEYHSRIHEFELRVRPGATATVSATLLATHMLVDEQRRPFVGLAAAINKEQHELSLRFDPEGVRVGIDGTIYVSDEYGPNLFAFTPDGVLRRRIPIPTRLKVLRPAASEDEEHATNEYGRQTNRGFEGLAISRDGKKLYAMLQGPLLQDHPFDMEGNRLGRHCRLVEVDLDSDKTREFVYTLDQANLGISEVLMIDDCRLLVLERDSKAGTAAVTKRLYEADFGQATDVGQIRSLGPHSLPQNTRPLTKRLFLDLMDPQLGLPVGDVPAKIEGVAFGPNFADGRAMLVVCSDNDFKGHEDSRIYVFAVDRHIFPVDSPDGLVIPQH